MQEKQKGLGLIALSWPIFIELLLHMTIGSLDTMMLGTISDDAVAAVGVANQLLFVVIVLFGLVSTGTGVLVAQGVGARNRKVITRVAMTSIAMNTIFGMLVSLMLIGFAEPLLGWMGLSDALMGMAVLYVRLTGAFLFLEAMMMAMSAVVRGHGMTREAMHVTIGMNVIHLVGNSIALLGWFGLPVFGIMGVAISTVVSRMLGVVGMYLVMQSKIKLRWSFRTFFAFPRKSVHDLLRIGVPTAGEHLSYHTSQLFITYLIVLMGAHVLATKIYVQNLTMFVFLFSASIAMGTQIIAGQLMGALRMDEAYQFTLRSLKISIVASIVMAVAIAMATPYLLLWFTDDPVILGLGSAAVWMLLLVEPGRCFNMVLIGSLRAAGDTRFPVMMGVLSMWGVSVPLAYWFGIHLGYGLTGVLFAFAVDEWLRGLFMLWRWRSRTWEKMVAIQSVENDQTNPDRTKEECLAI